MCSDRGGLKTNKRYIYQYDDGFMSTSHLESQLRDRHESTTPSNHSIISRYVISASSEMSVESRQAGAEQSKALRFSLADTRQRSRSIVKTDDCRLKGAALPVVVAIAVNRRGQSQPRQQPGGTRGSCIQELVLSAGSGMSTQPTSSYPLS